MQRLNGGKLRLLAAHPEARNRAIFGHLKLIAEQRGPAELPHKGLGKLGERIRNDDHLGKLAQLI